MLALKGKKSGAELRFQRKYTHSVQQSPVSGTTGHWGEFNAAVSPDRQGSLVPEGPTASVEVGIAALGTHGDEVAIPNGEEVGDFKVESVRASLWQSTQRAVHLGLKQRAHEGPVGQV